MGGGHFWTAGRDVIFDTYSAYPGIGEGLPSACGVTFLVKDCSNLVVCMCGNQFSDVFNDSSRCALGGVNRIQTRNLEFAQSPCLPANSDVDGVFSLG